MTPKMPEDKVVDLLFRFQAESQKWRTTPDTSTEWNDNGRLKYKFTWLEYLESAAESRPGTVKDSAIQVYRVPTDMASNIVMAKSLEKALELYK